MASEAEPSGEDIMKAAHEDAGVEIPRESAMSRKLQQIISRFRIREEGSRRFTSEEEEAERLDTEIKKFSPKKTRFFTKTSVAGHRALRERADRRIGLETSI